MNRKVIIGSRGSDLALWQARFVQSQLQTLGCPAEIQIIKTQGDKIQHLSFDKMEGKGFFTKELEEALLNKSVDLAIHSHKDLETTQPAGLCIAAVSYRENPAEWLLIRPEAVDELQLFGLKRGATVGTSAARRKSQLAFYRPDVEVADLRGNVPTRVDKLRQGQYDAILLAAAGAQRLQLDLSEFRLQQLDPRVFVPAPAQGVLAYQVREDDAELRELIGQLNQQDIAQTTGLERKVLNLLHGGCRVPFGAFCTLGGGGAQLWAYYASEPGHERRLYLQMSPDNMQAELVLKRLREPLSGTVLFTRNLRASTRELLLTAGLKVTEQSFIRIEATGNAAPAFNEFQWIFFTSPNAVEHFGSWSETPEHMKIAAIGSGTAATLAEKGVRADFVGDGDTALIASDFMRTLVHEKALIVCAEDGLRTIQQGLKNAQYAEWKVYRTVSRPEIISEIPSVVAFTSPSNVAGFLAANSWKPGMRAVAIGSSTEKALQQHGIPIAAIAWQSSEQAVADTVLGII